MHDQLSLATVLHPRKKAWNLECWFLGLVGAAMLWRKDLSHDLTVIQETIILVVFLGGLMGITRIPFPATLRGKLIPLWAFPLVSGFISGFMDSFLVLLLVGGVALEGSEKDQLKFRAINMIAALIGGLTLYFGEVYMLPLALQYGQRYWYSMLPIVPPVVIFLVFLAWRITKVNVIVLGAKKEAALQNGTSKKTQADTFDYLEFAVAIVLLLVTHNALLCLGILLVYAFVSGQGEDLIDVLKTETEIGVVLLLIFAAFVAAPAEPYLQIFSGWWAFIPATVNGVLTGAIYPTSGDLWQDALVLSTAVLVTPISSLVGVMLFKTWDEWKGYIAFVLPIVLVWFLIAASWFYGPWPVIRPHFEAVFGTPVLQAKKAPE